MEETEGGGDASERRRGRRTREPEERRSGRRVVEEEEEEREVECSRSVKQEGREWTDPDIETSDMPLVNVPEAMVSEEEYTCVWRLSEGKDEPTSVAEERERSSGVRERTEEEKVTSVREETSKEDEEEISDWRRGAVLSREGKEEMEDGPGR